MNPEIRINSHSSTANKTLFPLQIQSTINSQKGKLFLQAKIPESNQNMEEQFFQHCLKLKINSFGQNSDINQQFLQKLKQFKGTIRKSFSQEEFFSQIFFMVKAYEIFSVEQLQKMMMSTCFLFTTIELNLAEIDMFLKKNITAFTFSCTALKGTSNAFLPTVHKGKNHEGSINFAKEVRNKIFLKKDFQEQKNFKVQDPYSIRCSPQVYGIVYDTFKTLKEHFQKVKSRSQDYFVKIEGKNMVNLLSKGQNQTLLLDYFTTSLNEIGSIAFMRIQRMMNHKLAKQCIQNEICFPYLWGKLQKIAETMITNRQLGYPSSTDHMNIYNFEKDIYSNQGKACSKFLQMFNNVKEIVAFQVLVSIVAINKVYEDGQNLEFEEKNIQEDYEKLREKLHKQDIGNLYKDIKDHWLTKA